MNSIKEQLGYEEIGLDDTFTFHCTQCGKCCIHREDILLSPKDLFNIAKKFQITPAEALEQYCETYIGCNSRFPIVRLRPQGSVKRCPLLKDQKCLVHDVNPTVCAMFPIGRYLTLSADDSFPKNPYEFQYMMLSRLQSDCEYYLNYGNRCTGHLYYHNESKQIAAMKKLWNEFPDDGKPEWLTWKQILEYEKAMCQATNN